MFKERSPRILTPTLQGRHDYQSSPSAGQESEAWRKEGSHLNCCSELGPATCFLGARFKVLSTCSQAHGTQIEGPRQLTGLR